MNSSTSSSDRFPWPAEPEAEDLWRRFGARTLAMFVALVCLFYVVAVPLDPYDTGLLTPLKQTGTFAKGPRIGNASRVRDERFDAAIFGNSHIMSLSPSRLSDASGFHFAMLAIPGTDALEQMQVVDAYLTRHSPPRAAMFAIDAEYCQTALVTNNQHPFPDWLYSPRLADYLVGLAQWETLPAIGQRAALLFGLKRPQPPDGTMDIFDGHKPDAAADEARVAASPRSGFTGDAAADRPALDLLAQLLDRLPPSTRVVLVLPPIAPSMLPPPDTASAASLAACKGSLAALTKRKRNIAVVDWMRDDPALSGPGKFFDGSHYFEPVARRVEADVVAALNAAQPSSSGP
jgi:hypothetical protein